jgi:hypothetical protein
VAGFFVRNVASAAKNRRQASKIRRSAMCLYHRTEEKRRGENVGGGVSEHGSIKRQQIMAATSGGEQSRNQAAA